MELQLSLFAGPEDTGGCAREWSAEEFCSRIRMRGGSCLERVVFRRNRVTIWSLTQNGRVLNLHSAFRRATLEVEKAFATIVARGGRPGAELRRAADIVRQWPPLLRDLEELNGDGAVTLEGAPGRSAVHAGGMGSGAAADGNAADRAADAVVTGDENEEVLLYVADLYAHFNRTRFQGRLPRGLRIRLSRRMKNALGHMLPGPQRGGRRTVQEVALSRDLLVKGNETIWFDTFLHELAHVAAYLIDGERGHGPPWKRWAEIAGCRPERCHRGAVVRARGGGGVSLARPPDA
ncbi:MAG: SprT-like domain-containing protein [Gemmatimonadota bacterium]